MPATTLAQAEAFFGDFYAPRFEVAAGGESLDAEVLRDITQVSYTDSTTEIDSFDLTVNNWDPSARRFRYVGSEENVQGGTTVERLFNPGARELTLKLGYGAKLIEVCRGSAASLEPSFPAGGASTLTVRLVNALHQLRTKRYREHWPNGRVSQVTISRVAQDIGNLTDEGRPRFPLPIRVNDEAMSRERAIPYLAQDNEYDVDFLVVQARRFGYVVYMDRESSSSDEPVLRLGPPDARHPGVPDVTYDLKWGVSLMEFTPRLSTANLVSAVTVRGWDREANAAIRARVDFDDDEVQTNRDLFPLLVPPDRQSREEDVVNEPQYTEDHARRRALDILSERLRQAVEASGTTVGLPHLRAGQKIWIRGVGARFSGKYFVTQTTHTVNSGGYLTRFTAQRLRGEGGPGARGGRS